MASYKSSAVAEVRWSDSASELEAVSSSRPRAVANLERGSRMRAVMRAQMRARWGRRGSHSSQYSLARSLTPKSSRGTSSSRTSCRPFNRRSRLAQQKSLKSLLAEDLSVSATTGTPFLGHFEVRKQIRVLYMAGEAGLPIVQENFRRICLARGLSLASVGNLLVTDRLPDLR